jgi:hypothetical protein
LSSEGISAADTDDASNEQTVIGGTATIYMTKSYVASALANEVVITPINPWEHSVQDTYTTTTWTLRGGSIDLANGTGYLDIDGGTVITNYTTGKSLVLWDIRFDLASHSLIYTLKNPDGNLEIAGLDLAGPKAAEVKGTTATYTARDTFMNRVAAAAMKEDLETVAFEDEGLFGGFTATFELEQPAPADGVFTYE